MKRHTLVTMAIAFAVAGCNTGGLIIVEDAGAPMLLGCDEAVNWKLPITYDGGNVAWMYAPAQTMALSAIAVPATDPAGEIPTVELLADASGHPCTDPSCVIFGNASTSWDSGVLTFTSPNPSQITAGKPYWVAMSFPPDMNTRYGRSTTGSVHTAFCAPFGPEWLPCDDAYTADFVGACTDGGAK